MSSEGAGGVVAPMLDICDCCGQKLKMSVLFLHIYIDTYILRLVRGGEQIGTWLGRGRAGGRGGGGQEDEEQEDDATGQWRQPQSKPKTGLLFSGYFSKF